MSKELTKMLKIPIDLYKDVLKLLKIKHYSTLYEHLDYIGRKSICHYLVNSALENETIISTTHDVIFKDLYWTPKMSVIGKSLRFL